MELVAWNAVTCFIWSTKLLYAGLG